MEVWFKGGGSTPPFFMLMRRVVRRVFIFGSKTSIDNSLYTWYKFYMPQVLSIELYQLLEEKLGKEEAKKVASAIEIGFEVIEKKADSIALQKKLEIREELAKEIASKSDILLLREEFFGETRSIRQEMQAMRQEMQTIRQEMQTIKVELEGKIELVKADAIKLDMKLNFLIVLMIIALTLMNPVMAEIIKNLLKL